MDKIINKIKSNRLELEKVLLERKELIDLSFLALFSGESIFMLGKPGVAKSLLARQLKNILKDSTHFEYLMNRFSTPEEIFGPIKLSELNNDKFERKIEKYLPSSNIAFLDEIWKASPAIQNTLLTIINEKIFRNGDEDIKVPLNMLISASNELPEPNLGLEALYDRFLIRYLTSSIENEDNFKFLVNNNYNSINVLEENKITKDEIKEVKENAKKINVPDYIFDFIFELRKKLEVELEENSPYISDRRWKKIFNVLRVNAVLSQRSEIGIEDLDLIKNMIWDNPDQKKLITKVFDNIFVDLVSKQTDVSFNEITDSFDNIKEKINKLKIPKHKLIKWYSQTEDYYGSIYKSTTKETEYHGFKWNDSNYYIVVKNDSLNTNININEYARRSGNSNSYFILIEDGDKNYTFTSKTATDINDIIKKGDPILEYTINESTKEESIKEISYLDKKIALLQVKLDDEIMKLNKINSIFNTNWKENLSYAKQVIEDSINNLVVTKNKLILEDLNKKDEKDKK
ncbi:AAA family ATPase [Mycoplasma sp. CSL10166]|uniref:AAA family ATPase n=1 Tax=Mycoplasma sp. CSL10166 TaxID=2813825 RepID=UPI00197CAB29|nr:AAA family ATPase [Mycoplasma sp. CSL10166]MBN4084418.1 AAA family ATPase [Mycoplasma sp. CSL10166]